MIYAMELDFLGIVEGDKQLPSQMINNIIVCASIIPRVKVYLNTVYFKLDFWDKLELVIDKTFFLLSIIGF